MFVDTLSRWMGNVRDELTKRSVRACFTPVFDCMSSAMISTAGLVIKTGGSALAKSGAAAAYAIANGVLQKIAAATDMPALVGSVANTKFNVFCFFIDQAGVITTAMGTEGATLAAAMFPDFPLQKALVGFIIINPTGTGPFIGGTTALDDATVVPNAVFISALAGFDPDCLIG
jgi:hypothetical protein